MSNVLPLHPKGDNLRLGKLTFTRTEQIKRRVQFLVGLRDKGKMIRGRTVRRCLEVIETKGALLSEFLHSLREYNPGMLTSILDLYTEELVIHGYLPPGYKESVLHYLKTSQGSNSEIELISRMLEKLGINEKDFHIVLRGNIIQNLQLVENQKTYELMRKTLPKGMSILL